MLKTGRRIPQEFQRELSRQYFEIQNNLAANN